MINRSLIIITLFSMSGCAIHKTDFNCPEGKGLGCKSMNEIHRIMSQSGEFQASKSNHNLRIWYREQTSDENYSMIAKYVEIEGK